MNFKKFGLVAFLAASLFATGLITNQAFSEGAVVINDPAGCQVIDGAGNIVNVPDGHLVATNSKNGNSVVKCFGTGLPNIPESTVKWNFANTGLICFNVETFQVTQKWQAIADTEGNGVLTCQFKGV